VKHLSDYIILISINEMYHILSERIPPFCLIKLLRALGTYSGLADSNDKKHRNFLYVTVFVTGLVILMLEVLGSRVMGPFFGISLYIWASLISVTLIALSLGYWLGGTVADRKSKPTFLYSIILCSAIAILLIQFISAPVMEWSYNLLGIRGGVLLSALFIFSVPLILLGMASPYVIRLLVKGSGTVGRVAGSVFAISTMGSVIGALLTAFVLIPNLGVNKSFTLGALLLLFLPGVYTTARKEYYQVLITLLIIAISLFLLFFYKKTLVKDDLRQIIYQTDSLYGQLKVVDIQGSDLRAALIDGALQSFVYRSASHGSPAMDYVKLFIQLLPTYQKGGGGALIIGLGGGEIPRFVSKIGYTNDIRPKG
jgi:predicted membrane-bound spermidine synthase